MGAGCFRITAHTSRCDRAAGQRGSSVTWGTALLLAPRLTDALGNLFLIKCLDVFFFQGNLTSTHSRWWGFLCDVSGEKIGLGVCVLAADGACGLHFQLLSQVYVRPPSPPPTVPLHRGLSREAVCGLKQMSS